MRGSAATRKDGSNDPPTGVSGCVKTTPAGRTVEGDMASPFV